MVRKNERGITLIALVISIILLLIFVGIMIATLTGNNGILTRAQEAKFKTEEAQYKELLQLELQGCLNNVGNINLEMLNDNLIKNIPNILINGEKISEENQISKLPCMVSLNQYKYYILNDGKILDVYNIAEIKNTAKTFSKNIAVEDIYGNIFVLPTGFKITLDSADMVTGGIVIEDVNYENTIGSQFVWIPIGDIKTEDNQQDIVLNRYIFNEETGEEQAQNDNIINDVFQELPKSDLGNIVAKDIEEFKSKTEEYNGYYIARYEARTDVKRNQKEDVLSTLTVRVEDYVYNFVTQQQAAELSRGMYENSEFTSDLVNSYAWDTAVLFLQKNDDREGNNKKYSLQGSSNIDSLAEKGTCKLEMPDVICNIYDMASNCFEWTTETSYSNTRACAAIGGYYGNEYYTPSRRRGNQVDYSFDFQSFRPIIYFK